MVDIGLVGVQWWSLVLSNVWAMFEPPHVAVLVTAVLIINLGGVYNCIAYTVIRRRLQQQSAAHRAPVVTQQRNAIA